MKTVNYTEAQANLGKLMDRAIKNGKEVAIRRTKDEVVVMVSRQEWESMKETLYLALNPENARRLQASIDSLNRSSRNAKVRIPSWIPSFLNKLGMTISIGKSKTPKSWKKSTR